MGELQARRRRRPWTWGSRLQEGEETKAQGVGT